MNDDVTQEAAEEAGASMVWRAESQGNDHPSDNGEDFADFDSDAAERAQEEYDPVASAQLFQRTLRCFDPRFRGVNREQLAERRRKWAAKRAEMAREARTRAQSDQACRSRPEPPPVPRSRAVRTRRASTRSHATADPTPPPEPEPAAVSALARPPASPDTRVSALRGAADRVVGSLRTPRRDAVRLRCSASRRPPRSGAMLSLEQRLASFALTLASPSLSAALQAGVSARGH